MAYLFQPSLLYLLYQEELSPKARDRLWFLSILLLPIALLIVRFSHLCVVVALWLLAGYGKGPLEIELAVYLCGNNVKRIATLLNQSHRYEEALKLQGERALVNAKARHFANLAKEASHDDDAAMALFQQALQSFSPKQDLTAEFQIQKAEILNSLASLVQRKGDNAQALALFQQAIDLGSLAVTELDPRVTVWISNMGILQQEMGMYDKSSLSFQRVLTIKRNFQDSHAELVAEWCTSMAYLLFSRPGGEFEPRQVFALVEEALKIRQSLHVGDHVTVASSLNDCALFALLLGDGLVDREEDMIKLFTDAQQRGRDCADMYERLLGSDHPTAAKARADWY